MQVGCIPKYCSSRFYRITDMAYYFIPIFKKEFDIQMNVAIIQSILK
jgi:hypothetical protein